MLVLLRIKQNSMVCHMPLLEKIENVLKCKIYLLLTYLKYYKKTVISVTYVFQW